MARRRPSAFEVSFPEEAKREEALRKQREEDNQERKRHESILVAQQVDQKKLKRKEREMLRQKEKKGLDGRILKSSVEIDEDNGVHQRREMEEVDFVRPAKKIQLELPTEFYFSRTDEIRENADTFLEGEDELFSDDDDDDDEEEGSGTGRNQPRDKQKPIRLLTGFTIFDTRHRNEYVVLSKIEEEDGVDRRFEVAGWIVPYYIDEEDLIGEDVEGGGGGEIDPVYMRIGPLLRYSVDWTKDKDPFYIETPHAWYILKMPAEKYIRWYQEFYTPRRVAQMVIAHAMKKHQLSFDSFVLQILNNAIGIFGERFEEDELWAAAEIIREAIDEVEQENINSRIRQVPVIAHILKHAPLRTLSRPRSRPGSSLRRKSHLDGPSRLRTNLGLFANLRNPDLVVLKQENQNPIHVTPLIASLARGFVNEELIVVGPPPKKGKDGLQSDAALMKERRAQTGLLWKLIERVRGGVLDVDWKKEDRVMPRSNYLRKVWVGGEVYKPGDFVLVPYGKYGQKNMTPEWPKDVRHLPVTASIANYFWFARIMYIKNEEQIAHVQWLEHASQTMLQEIANPQELFFCTLCNPVPLGCLVAKVKVHLNPTGPVKSDEYLVRYIHDKSFATYVALSKDYHQGLEHYLNPTNHSIRGPVLDYCPSCIAMEEDNHKMQWQYEPTPPRNQDKGRGQGSDNRGIVFNGRTYHVFDFVLYRAERGPSNIGQIIDFIIPKFGSRTTMVLKVKRLGRVWDLVGTLVDLGEEMKDERHVFLTDEEKLVAYTDVITKAVVLSYESFGQRLSLRKWLGTSPCYFYVRYRFPKIIPESWDERTRISFRDLNVCKKCTEETIKYYYDINEFQNKMHDTPMRAFDLFGGTGAFSLGIKEGSRCMKVTHALEISPSAAKSFQKNCVGTVVINQCVNVLLRYVIKRREGHRVERPFQLWDKTGKTPIPDPPVPGSVDILTAGFPCQSHSGLNMFKTANDVKSNLMLTALSWVDYYRPQYVYMENVAGFLSFNLSTKQAGLHKVTGGITMGGLKLLIRSLLEMGYQVRYSLLQAGHYGAPQRRVRFFLIGALSTPKILPLPDLPQPTHDFPSQRLLITMPNGDTVKPVRSASGTAPHPFVSIEDAIGDLLKFDWKLPGKNNRTGRMDGQGRAGIPAIVCDPKKPHCGYQGQVEYECEPRTSYQKEARVKSSADLQHFTKTLKARKVDRVLAIPLRPGADYRCLGADRYDWVFANPVAPIARGNFRPGWYGRLDKDGYFPTIVTHVDPMAKQCRVLHPSCKRMVTVRELARAQGFPDWFVFESYRGNVITMHRQIGNAVSFPLSRALGRELGEVLYKEWKEGRLERVMGERARERDREGRGRGEVESSDEDNEMEMEDINGDQDMRDVDRESDVDSMEGLYT